jgi:hypothetical protein
MYIRLAKSLGFELGAGGEPALNNISWRCGMEGIVNKGIATSLAAQMLTPKPTSILASSRSAHYSKK